MKNGAAVKMSKEKCLVKFKATYLLFCQKISSIVKTMTKSDPEIISVCPGIKYKRGKRQKTR